MSLSLRPLWMARSFVVASAATFIMCLSIQAQERRPRTELTEPVYRVSNARVEPAAARLEKHPLDDALKVAREGLHLVRSKVDDYSCILVKRERVKGVLNDPEYMYAEVRNEKVVDGKIVAPFSVYMRFLKPDRLKGREVIYVKGHNNDKLVAKESGRLMQMMPPVWLRPEGPIAMRGQLYPITDVGLENLIVKLIEKGERDRKRGECAVDFVPAAINGRKCTVLNVKHPVKRSFFDFHIAQIFIDDELNLPVRYVAYTWPKTEGGRPVLMEEYTYLDIKVNIGLTDKDFDHTVKFAKR